jgi:hypothetical protein
VILDGVRVDTYVEPLAGAEQIGDIARYTAQKLAEGWRMNMQGGWYRAPEA